MGSAPYTRMPPWLLLQVRAREEELSSLSSLHNSTKAAYEHRVVELEGRVARCVEGQKGWDRPCCEWGPACAHWRPHPPSTVTTQHSCPEILLSCCRHGRRGAG